MYKHQAFFKIVLWLQYSTMVLAYPEMNDIDVTVFFLQSQILFYNCVPLLTDLIHKKPYNITVTPLFDDKTGHGTQAVQICSRVGGNLCNRQIILFGLFSIAYLDFFLNMWSLQIQEMSPSSMWRLKTKALW